tara:strand:+ start:759 stop:1151 length:393 start_codon:yes stop_codon:yes gene_type:complete
MAKKRKKRSRSSSGSSSSSSSSSSFNNRPTKKYHLIQENDILESGSKRKLQNLLGEYNKLGMEKLNIVDDNEYQMIKRRKLITKQNIDYEKAKEKDKEKEKLMQMKEDFKDPIKRREIIYNSYQKHLKLK